MNMKKWGMSLLCAVLMVGLAACGGGDDSNKASPSGESPSATTPASASAPSSGGEEEVVEPEAGAKLKVWESKEQMPYMKKVAEGFEKEFGIPVTFEEVAGGDQGGRLATDGPAKLAGDVVSLPHDQIAQAVKAGLLLPNDLFEEETRGSMLEAGIKASSYDGVLYGYPKSVETYAMFYNKDLFPEAPKTWDEIVNFAGTFTNAKENKYAIMWEFVGYYSYPFIGSFGGYFFGKDNTDPSDIGLNNPGTIEGFEFLKTLKPILPMNAADVTYDVKTQLFTDGKLALNIDGPWSVSAFKDKVNFGVAPLPAMPNGKPSTSFSGVKSYYVNSYSQYPIAARMFANYAANKENQLLNYEMTGAIPANREAGEDPKIKDDPIVSGFFQQFANSTPMPGIAEINAVWDPLKAAFTTLWDDPKADVKATLDSTVNTIQTVISSK
jgi:arabinogalactan oligomer/maltooligosaccharide transport system substrate-binding protein